MTMKTRLSAWLACTLLGSTLLLGACGPQNPRNYNPRQDIKEYSDAGQTREVRNGDTIIHYQGEIISDVLRVPQNLVNNGGGLMVQIFIPAGTYPKTGEDDKRIFFSRKSTRGYVAKAGSEHVEDIVYTKSSGKLNLKVPGELILRGWDSGFSILKDSRLKVRDEDYQNRSLVYAGSTGTLLSFRFKEGKNSHRLTHNMNDGKVFRYEGAEVEIVSYIPQVLTCRVLKEFDLFLR